MYKKPIVEIFSAGCPACQDTIDMINRMASECCDVRILDMHDAEVARRAKSLSVRSVPAVAVDGKLLACCAGRGPSENELKAAGVGQAL